MQKESFDEMRIKSKIDYQTIIMFQVDRVMRLSTTVPFTREGNNVSNLGDIQTAYKYGVANLERLLSPYLDDEYRKAIKKIDAKNDYIFRMEQFELLMHILYKRNLLLERSGLGVIGYD